MKIIHFSGLRLGAPFPEWPARGAEIRRELRAILERLMARAASEGCAAVLSAGDMFDSNSVPAQELQAVAQICGGQPAVPLVLLPGARDPWGPYSVYRHLAVNAPPNLHVLNPGRTEPHRICKDLWIYGQGVDVNTPVPVGLADLEPGSEEGIHIAVAYGDLGRLKPGPEEGLVMISPNVTNHPFDFLALADGGPAEQLGGAQRPVCYAAPQGPFCEAARGGGTAWAVEFGTGAPRVERLDLGGFHRIEIHLDVTGFADLGTLAQAIRHRIEAGSLAHVILTGTRSADRVLLEPALMRLCTGDVFALRLTDRTRTQAPEAPADRDPAVVLLWERLQQAPEENRREWQDALKLYAAGITDPARWQEAPWARS